MKQGITISICPFNNGDFDIIIQDPGTGEEITFSGVQKLNIDELELVNRLAPACVFTTYERDE